MRRFIPVFSAVFLVSIAAAQSTITPSQPTHYYYTPMARVNPPNHLVLGLHEISFGLPANLQVQASFLDNIGRVNIGAKFGLNEKMAIGAGLAHSIMHLGSKAHGVPSWAPRRLGGFLTWEFMETPAVEAALTPHTQIGSHISIGCDIGIMADVHQVWSLIGEVGTSVDLSDQALYLNADGGLRIHPPSLPFLNFDFGVDLEEFLIDDAARMSAAVYFDVLFSLVVR